jgi:hypothetical protein
MESNGIWKNFYAKSWREPCPGKGWDNLLGKVKGEYIKRAEGDKEEEEEPEQD